MHSFLQICIFGSAAAVHMIRSRSLEAYMLNARVVGPENPNNLEASDADVVDLTVSRCECVLPSHRFCVLSTYP